MISFADDTVIIYIGENWTQTKLIAENHMKILKNWFDKKLLTINFKNPALSLFPATTTSNHPTNN